MDQRTVRQEKCQRRSRRSRLVARLLIPILMLSISYALWSDPAIARKLREGHAIAFDIAQALFERHRDQQAQANIVDEPPAIAVHTLPQSQVPIRRPAVAITP